ncbi:MAG: hypothetical protein K8R59_18610, partial [Thermoanaerobaculales bacterium]|nr:hypothetical protein [Thermoanaerobaculales bacterium]
MRTLLLAAILGSQGLALVNAAIEGRNLKNFLDRTPSLSTTLDLDRFKAVAARQMIAALMQGALLILAPICFIWGLFTGTLNPGDFVWVLLPAVIVILVATSYRKLEKQAWSLPTQTDELR